MSHPTELARVAATNDPSSLRKYLTDESSAYRGTADIAYLPRDDAQMAAVLEAAATQQRPVTVVGAGTAITGAGVPSGGVVLSTERVRRHDGLSAIPDAREGGSWTEITAADFSFLVDVESKTAVVPSGVRLFELNQALSRTGLFYPPDPTEASAMIGGTVATNASGARSYRFGPTRNWVEGVLAVTAGGSDWILRGEHVEAGGKMTLPRCFGGTALAVPAELPVPQTKNASGLLLRSGVDLVDLIVGSEGVLCAVAAVMIRLAARPNHLLQVASFFSSQGAALDGADVIREAHDVLSIEYFDPTALEFMRVDHPDLPAPPVACVLFELDFRSVGEANPYPEPSLLRAWDERLEDLGSAGHWAVTGAEVEAMKGFRHSLPEQVNRWVAARVGKLGTDMAVPAGRFREMVSAYEEARRQGVRSVLFGHLGQYHLHLNFLPETEDELAEAKRLYRGLAETAVALGGTVSAEHGVGKKQLRDAHGVDRPYLWYMYGDEGLSAVSAVKRQLDPAWILNPGTMIPAPRDAR